MRVNVIGTRGFPNIQGGVERHCEALFPLIADMGWEVKTFRRKPYINKSNTFTVFRKVQFCDIWAPRNKNLEAAIHSLMASVISLYDKPDVVHLHNIGPSLVLPLLKLGSLKTVVTYHSANYEHGKWGRLGKTVLKICEKIVSRFADQVIFVSETQKGLVECKGKTHIPNGVSVPSPSSSSNFIFEIGAVPREYILAVARFAPEKGLHDLINAFKTMNSDCKLVIAGDADHETEYSKTLRQMAAEDDRIILTGYITGEPLNQVYSHARLFVLPSYHEGLPIALLEALSYGLPVLASDIPANKEVGLPDYRYFRCGDVDDLKRKMEVLLEKGLSEGEAQELQKQITEKYNWDNIAGETIEVYRKAQGASRR